MSLVGISVDPIENNQAMVEKLLLLFPLLSDPEGRVIKEWSPEGRLDRLGLRGPRFR
jgi:peroxiredoxin